jgi:hypothetical protein
MIHWYSTGIEITQRLTYSFVLLFHSNISKMTWNFEFSVCIIIYSTRNLTQIQVFFEAFFSITNFFSRNNFFLLKRIETTFWISLKLTVNIADQKSC